MIEPIRRAKRDLAKYARVPESVQEHVVDVGRLTVALNALATIEEEVDHVDFRIASYPNLKDILMKCRRIARQALGKEEVDE